jgi:hypothetical protein
MFDTTRRETDIIAGSESSPARSVQVIRAAAPPADMPGYLPRTNEHVTGRVRSFGHPQARRCWPRWRAVYAETERRRDHQNVDTDFEPPAPKLPAH